MEVEGALGRKMHIEEGMFAKFKTSKRHELRPLGLRKDYIIEGRFSITVVQGDASSEDFNKQVSYKKANSINPPKLMIKHVPEPCLLLACPYPLICRQHAWP